MDQDHQQLKKTSCLAAELGSMAASFVELADIPSTSSARKEAEKEMEVTVLDEEKEIVANASYKLWCYPSLCVALAGPRPVAI